MMLTLACSTLGRPADVVVCGSITGSAGTTLSDAIAHGDLPGITHVLIDGEFVVTERSRQTPPPTKRAFFCCCDTGRFEARGRARLLERCAPPQGSCRRPVG